MLGAKYDPPLIAFANEIGKRLNSYQTLPQVLSIRAQPQAIMRSIIGHMCAQGTDRYLKGPLTEAVRDYFLDDSAPLPDGLRFFYWAYPYRPQVMIRDASYLYIPNGNPFVFWLMKFFPIAFMVTWNEPSGLLPHIESLEKWRAAPYSATADLPISRHPLISQYWPEAPANDETIILVGREAIVANNRQPRKA